MREKPIANRLVVPLEIREWFVGFCDNNLVHFEEGQPDSYQTWVIVCYSEETAKLNTELSKIRLEMFYIQ